MLEFFHISFWEVSKGELVILLAFTVLLLFRFLYLFLVPARVAFQKKQVCNKTGSESLSLLLPYRNEEENLKKYLAEILKIDNVDFEVIAVDDFSQDNSLPVLGVMRTQNPKLHVSSLNQETRFSEKLAQNIALKAAKNNWTLVISSAVSKFEEGWLKCISGLMSERNEVAINYSNVIDSGHFYNRLFRVELFQQQLKSAGFSLLGLPFTYTEENIAFRKKKYFEIGGYGQKVKEPFANLELIINQFIKKKTTVIYFQRETTIWRNDKIKRSDYYDLLKKSFRIEKYLSVKKQVFLFFDEFTRLLFLPLLIIVIVFLPEFWLLIGVVIVLRIILYLVIIKMALNHLNERKIFISSLVYELLMPYYKVFYRWHFNRQSRKQRWRSNI